VRLRFGANIGSIADPFAAGAVAIAAAGGMLLSSLVTNSFAQQGQAQGQAQGKGRGNGKAKAPSRPTPHWPDGG